MLPILTILLQLQQERESKNIVPRAVLYTDLQRDCIEQGYCLEDVRNELNSLAVAKKIKVHRTINGRSIEIRTF